MTSCFYNPPSNNGVWSPELSFHDFSSPAHPSTPLPIPMHLGPSSSIRLLEGNKQLSSTPTSFKQFQPSLKERYQVREASKITSEGYSLILFSFKYSLLPYSWGISCPKLFHEPWKDEVTMAHLNLVGTTTWPNTLWAYQQNAPQWSWKTPNTSVGSLQVVRCPQALLKVPPVANRLDSTPFFCSQSCFFTTSELCNSRVFAWLKS